VFARLEQNYFDWNEIRVTSIAELSLSMTSLSDPSEAARRLKGALHGIFETHYAFDIDALRKQNLGAAVKDFQELGKLTKFGLAYVTQYGLSGHTIPINRTSLQLLVWLGLISEAEAAAYRVPGLERTISKKQGPEFGSLLHQLAVDFAGSPFSPRVRNILVEIAPEVKERLPKRAVRKATVKSKKKVAAKGKEKTADKAPTKKKSAAKVAKKKAATKKAATKKAATKKAVTKKVSRKTADRTAAKNVTKKKTAAKGKAAARGGPKSTKSRKKVTKASKKPKAGKSTTKRLAKKKPR
jgi:endonuclease-3